MSPRSKDENGRALAPSLDLGLAKPHLSPAPPSLIPGHLSFAGSVATIIALPALTVLCLDRGYSMHGGLLSELQSPLRHSCSAGAVSLLQDALARRVVLIREAWLLERRVAMLVEACVAGCGTDGRWGDWGADHGNW